MNKYLDDLKIFGAENINIFHEMTPRYFRAFRKRLWILNNSKYLGMKKVDDCIEIAVWAENAQGGKKCGAYSAFRVFYGKDLVMAAELYAFYDGLDQSICLKTKHEALIYAQEWGFEYD